MENKIDYLLTQAKKIDRDGMYFDYEELRNGERLMPRFKRWWRRNAHQYFKYNKDGMIKLSLSDVDCGIPDKFYVIRHYIQDWLEKDYQLEGYEKKIKREIANTTIYFTKS